jgi:hypothetical protein
MQRVRVPKEPIHHIHTAFGDSKTSFAANTGTVPIQGIGQGNGAGPQIWALISTPIFNMLRDMHYGIKLQSSISNQDLFFVGFGFVDDTDLAILNDEHKSAREAARVLQKAVQVAQLWSRYGSDNTVREDTAGLV